MHQFPAFGTIDHDRIAIKQSGHFLLWFYRLIYVGIYNRRNCQVVKNFYHERVSPAHIRIIFIFRTPIFPTFCYTEGRYIIIKRRFI